MLLDLDLELGLLGRTKNVISDLGQTEFSYFIHFISLYISKNDVIFIVVLNNNVIDKWH